MTQATAATTNASATATDMVPGNKMHNRILTFNENGRANILGLAVGGVYGDGYCKGIYAFYMGSSREHTAFWSVKCSDDQKYLVSFNTSDTIDPRTVRVTPCTVVQAVGLECFTKVRN